MAKRHTKDESTAFDRRPQSSESRLKAADRVLNDSLIGFDLGNQCAQPFIPGGG